jgi:hypothetical protein
LGLCRCRRRSDRGRVLCLHAAPTQYHHRVICPG